MEEKTQIDGYSPEYEAFVAKFKARHTSDDTFTPKNIYETVRDWCVRRYALDGAPIVRPFWPGGDYTRADYPSGCAVIDNPPFSILSKIVSMYNARRIRFFLFAPSQSSLQAARDGQTTFVATHITINFDNGADINVSFLTNMEAPGVLATSAPDLRDALRVENNENKRKRAKKVARLALPAELVTASVIGYLATHHVRFTIRRSEALFVRKLDNLPGGVYGGGFLVSPRVSTELAESMREADEHAEAERAARIRADRDGRLVVDLSPTEIRLIQSMEGND